MQGREGNSTSLTALGVFSAPEDAGCPRLVGRRPVALRQHLPAFEALPLLQLYSHTAQRPESDRTIPIPRTNNCGSRNRKKTRIARGMARPTCGTATGRLSSPGRMSSTPGPEAEASWSFFSLTYCDGWLRLASAIAVLSSLRPRGFLGCRRRGGLPGGEWGRVRVVE